MRKAETKTSKKRCQAKWRHPSILHWQSEVAAWYSWSQQVKRGNGATIDSASLGFFGHRQKLISSYLLNQIFVNKLSSGISNK